MDHQYRLVGKYLSGEASPAEKLELEEWIYESEENKQEFEELKSVWNLGIPNEDIESRDRVFNRIESRIKSQSRTEKAAKTFKIIPSMYRYAAIIVMVAVIGYLAIFNSEQEAIQSGNIEYITRTTESGQKSTIHLPDGSQVVLNSESTLRFPSQFGMESRSLELFGEAYFEVEKDPQRPFTVLTDDTETTVIGTSFNIKACRSENTVSLVEGRVFVKTRSEDPSLNTQIYLAPGQRAEFDSGQLSVSRFNYEREISWKDWL